LLAILSKKSGIEIGRIDGSRVISPFVNVSISEGSLNSNVVLLLPSLKLLRQGSVRGSLKLLDLISIEAVVIENLPLLWLTLVSFDASFSDSLGTDDILDPVFHLNEHLLHARIVIETCDCAWVPDHVLLIVIIIVVMLARSKLNSQPIHLLLLTFKGCPELAGHLLGANRRNSLRSTENVVIISAPSWEIFMTFRHLTDPGLSLSSVIIIKSLLNLLDIVVTVTERRLPVILVKVRVVSLIESARTRSRVPVLDLWRRNIILVASDADRSLKGIPDLSAASLDVSHKFINHNYYL